MPPERACSNCGVNDWDKSPNRTALTVLRKEGASYDVQMRSFQPVRTYVCKNCGKIEQYLDP